VTRIFWSILFVIVSGLKNIRTNYGDFPKWKYTKAGDLLLAQNGTPYVYLPEEGACDAHGKRGPGKRKVGDKTGILS